MRPNPASDILAFLTEPRWTTPVFWLLLLASVAIAVHVWRRDPERRSARNVAIWLLSVTTGIMWWQQSLWKIPPDYGGLMHWMQQMVDHATTELQSRLVRDVVLPNIALFGPLVYVIEVAVGVALILGVLTRLAAFIGALFIVNLWLGLYSAPNEWPWTYVFLIVIQLLFTIDPPGRCLGIDALLRHRRGERHGQPPVVDLVA